MRGFNWDAQNGQKVQSTGEMRITTRGKKTLIMRTGAALGGSARSTVRRTRFEGGPKSRENYLEKTKKNGNGGDHQTASIKAVITGPPRGQYLQERRPFKREKK